MIALSDLKHGPRKVRLTAAALDNAHYTREPFMLSAVECEMDRKPIGAWAIAYWPLGGKPIRKGKHKLMDAGTRDDWFSHLELAE